MEAICMLAEGQYRTLFTVLKQTGIRIGECCGLLIEDLDLANLVIYIRRSYSETADQTLDPKTVNGFREIDIDERLAATLREHIGTRTSGLVFRSEANTELRAGNIIKRVLNPILTKLGIPLGGKVIHAFRHGRVTVLRKKGIPGDLQKQWVGHSSLRTTDIYSHTDKELEYRRTHAALVGLTA